jgi:hypothetical protein
MSEENGIISHEEAISGRIFTASSSMVGICLTAIGLFRISDRLKNLSTLANEFLAFDSFVFLVACLISYLALRTKKHKNKPHIEKIADGIFIFGLCVMVIICGLIAYEFI